MRIRQLAALAIGVGVLTGCVITPFDPTAPQTPCPGSSCPVSVAVTATFNPFECNIVVQPDYLNVSAGPEQKTITWTLTVNGRPVNWPESGIKFDPNAESVVVFSEISGNLLSFTYRRRTGVHDHYGYAVNVRLPSRGIKCSLDPWVVD
jgi:hypothetical protein